MKFGKLDDVSGLDLRLPEDHADNLKVLRAGKQPFRLWVGGTMWNVPEWKGKIYPSKVKQSDFLFHYARFFNSIELNATHYRTPSVETVSNWVSQTPVGFRFSPKFPQIITHYRRFRNCEEPTNEFLKAVDAFGDRMGYSFIQLPPHFGLSGEEILIDYLFKLPEDLPLAVEFRHPAWFEPQGLQRIAEIFEKRKIGLVISDTAGRRDAVHMRLTAPFCIVRFGGNNLIASDENRLREWVDRIQLWRAHGLENFELWMHQPNSLLTPEACTLFAKLWTEKADAPFSLPWNSPAQATLF